MEHKITYRTPNGTLQETLFDNFDEFADSIDSIANQYYQGLKAPQVDVETIYDEGLIKKENVTNVEPRDGGTPEFLNEIGQHP
jgi:hypothetical protein